MAEGKSLNNQTHKFVYKKHYDVTVDEAVKTINKLKKKGSRHVNKQQIMSLISKHKIPYRKSKDNIYYLSVEDIVHLVFKL